MCNRLNPRVIRVLKSPPRGSSRPVLVDTDQGLFLLKLRGAAQGVCSLIAEIIVGEIAHQLGLSVLEPSLVTLDTTVDIGDKNDELADLLQMSVGLNLAFPYLAKANDALSDEINAISDYHKAALFWLDRFVLNPDRTVQNPNILNNCGEMIFIDFGASLRFQYAWSSLTEGSPSQMGKYCEPHLFEYIMQSSHWSTWEYEFASAVTRDVLNNAVEKVPEQFIIEMLLPGEQYSVDEQVMRRRAAYVAFLWKRLKEPRRFAHETPVFALHKPKPKFITDIFRSK